jgi:hypothetical protein
MSGLPQVGAVVPSAMRLLEHGPEMLPALASTLRRHIMQDPGQEAFSPTDKDRKPVVSRAEQSSRWGA